MTRIRSRLSTAVGCSAALTACLVAGCAETVQSRQPYREEDGMSATVLRPVQVVGSPDATKVVGSLDRGTEVTLLCFLKTAGEPVVRVEGSVDGYVVLETDRPVFSEGNGEVASTIATCD